MIPKIIWQTYKYPYDVLPLNIKKCIKTWSEMNPTYQHNYMNDNDAGDFILKCFGYDYYNLFMSFPIGVMRADFWRYLILYKFGGIYTDIDTICLEEINKWVDDTKYDFIVCPEGDKTYCQWTIACAAGHPIIKNVIDDLIKRYKEVDYNRENFVEYYTGSILWTYSLRKSLGLDEIKDCEKLKDICPKENEFDSARQNKFYCFGGDWEWKKFHKNLSVEHLRGCEIWGNEYIKWRDEPFLKTKIADKINKNFTIWIEFNSVKKFGDKTGITRTMFSLAKSLLRFCKDTNINIELITIEDDKIYTYNEMKEAILNLPLNSTGMKTTPLWRAGDVLFLIDIYNFSNRVSNHIAKLKNEGLIIIPFVHDLIPKSHPQYCHPDDIPRFLNWLNFVKSISSGVICNSNFTLKCLKNDGYTRQCYTCHLGCNENTEYKKISMPKGKNVLMVSTIDLRKMYNETIAQFEHLWKYENNINLIIVGKPGWSGTDEIIKKIETHENRMTNLFWLRNVSDGELNYLYKNADALLFASEIEGFGLAVIEAAKFGTPLILRDIPVFRELGSENATYFKDFIELPKILLSFLHHGLKTSKNLNYLTWTQSSFKVLSSIIDIRNSYANIAERALQESRNYSKEPVMIQNSFCVLKISDNKVEVVIQPKSFRERFNDVLQFFKCLLSNHKITFQGNLTIGLEDSYNLDTKGIFVFSRHKDARGQILLPDLYAMTKYGGNLDIKDDLQFEHKNTKALFIGVDTGITDETLNKRIQLCKWASNHKTFCECYISRSVQIPAEKIQKEGNFLLNRDISIPNQRKYKFLITMDGNTCAWDRFVWQLNSNSIVLKEQSDNINWYYPLMTNGKEYLEFEKFEQILSYMESTTIDFNSIITNAQRFVVDYLTFEKHLLYTAYLLNNLC